MTRKNQPFLNLSIPPEPSPRSSGVSTVTPPATAKLSASVGSTLVKPQGFVRASTLVNQYSASPTTGTTAKKRGATSTLQRGSSKRRRVSTPASSAPGPRVVRIPSPTRIEWRKSRTSQGARTATTTATKSKSKSNGATARVVGVGVATATGPTVVRVPSPPRPPRRGSRLSLSK